MKTTLLASSPTKDGLLKMINKCFYSSTFIMNADGTISNSNGLCVGVRWIEKKKRFRFEMIDFVT